MGVLTPPAHINSFRTRLPLTVITIVFIQVRNVMLVTDRMSLKDGPGCGH